MIAPFSRIQLFRSVRATVAFASFYIKITASFLMVHWGASNSTVYVSEAMIDWSSTIMAILNGTIFQWDFNWIRIQWRHHFIDGTCDMSDHGLASYAGMTLRLGGLFNYERVTMLSRKAYEWDLDHGLNSLFYPDLRKLDFLHSRAKFFFYPEIIM